MSGDFNNSSIKWSTLAGERVGSRLIAFVQDLFIHQIVDRPT